MTNGTKEKVISITNGTKEKVISVTNGTKEKVISVTNVTKEKVISANKRDYISQEILYSHYDAWPSSRLVSLAAYISRV